MIITIIIVAIAVISDTHNDVDNYNCNTNDHTNDNKHDCLTNDISNSNYYSSPVSRRGRYERGFHREATNPLHFVIYCLFLCVSVV